MQKSTETTEKEGQALTVKGEYYVCFSTEIIYWNNNNP